MSGPASQVPGQGPHLLTAAPIYGIFQLSENAGKYSRAASDPTLARQRRHRLKL